jgi:hypothetical protein
VGSYIITYTCLLTAWSRVLHVKLTGLQLVKKFPAFYVIHRFITTFTSVHHLALSWASSIQSIPSPPTFLRFILILSFHLLLGLPYGLFPSGFPTKTLYTPHLFPTHATSPAHLILLSFITLTIVGEEHRLLSSSLCSFLHSPHVITYRQYKWKILKNYLYNIKWNNNPYCTKLFILKYLSISVLILVVFSVHFYQFLKSQILCFGEAHQFLP